MLEFGLVELLHALPKEDATVLANGLRARVNEWALEAGPRFTARVDEMASEQLTSLLGALDDAPTMHPRCRAVAARNSGALSERCRQHQL